MGRSLLTTPAFMASSSMVSGSVQPLASASSRDEASLVAEARAGNREAQDTLVRRYLRDVHEVALRILGDRDLAQDAAQDAMVNALGGLARFRGEASFRTWLLRITMNSARSVARRRGRRREVALIHAENRPGDERDVASSAAIQDEAERIGRLLERLPTKQRMAVSLRVNQGLSYQEIGTILDCSEGAARVNYHLGIKRLRELMR
ncbi:MAG: RNA polymerase sigma factor [Longimicrobiales bacterium]